MSLTKLPLDSPYRKRISLSAMITCAKVQFGIGVLLMCFQVPASGFTYYESISRNLTTDTFNYHPISLFFIDCWFPGVVYGIFCIVCARFQFQKFSEAIKQVKNLHEEGSTTGERPKWAGIVLSKTKSFTLLLCTAIPAYAFLLVHGLGFGLAGRLQQDHPEVKYETSIFLVFFHVALLVCSVPAYILVLLGMSNLTIVTGHCCSYCYPYPVYLNLSEDASLIGVYGSRYRTDVPAVTPAGLSSRL